MTTRTASDAPITIAVVPRERSSAAPEAIATLLARTPEPFQLVVIDHGLPDPWAGEVRAVVADAENATIVEVDDAQRPLLPNAARNLAIAHATGDWICLLENDVLVGENWLAPLIAAAEATDAGAAVPLILERFGVFEKVHFDDRLHRIVETQRGRRIEARDDSKERDRSAERRPVHFIETHCMLFRRRALDAVGGFDAAITAQEEIDISFALFTAGETAVLEPASVVTFLPPPPVYPSEREYFEAKWNPETYRIDEKRMAERWNIVDYPSATGVVEARRGIAAADVDSQMEIERTFRTRLQATADDLAALTPRGTLVLAHDDQLDLSLVCPEADVLPFTERNGVWWGPPADSASALAELDRMREAGGATFAVGWPSFWYLEYYEEFAQALRDRHEILAETDQIVAFDLNTRLEDR